MLFQLPAQSKAALGSSVEDLSRAIQTLDIGLIDTLRLQLEEEARAQATAAWATSEERWERYQSAWHATAKPARVASGQMVLGPAEISALLSASEVGDFAESFTSFLREAEASGDWVLSISG